MTSTAIDVYQPLSNAQLEIIRKVVAPKASNDEIAFFAQFCDYYQLSPFMEQVYFADFGKGYKPYLGVNGRLALASRSGRLVGIDGPWFRKRRTDAEREAKYDGDWMDYWEFDGNPYVARCLVYRSDWRIPARGTALWRIWNKSNSSAWRQYPEQMLGNKALVRALKQAFPEHNVTRELEPDEEYASSENMIEATIEAGFEPATRAEPIAQVDPETGEIDDQDDDEGAANRRQTTAEKAEQIREIQNLFMELGCRSNSDEDVAARRAVVRDCFGHDVNGGDMTADDRAKLLKYLHSLQDIGSP